MMLCAAHGANIHLTAQFLQGIFCQSLGGVQMKFGRAVAMGLVTAVMGLAGCAQKPIATEHGWKTNRVVATRMKNAAMGQFVKFEFPQNGYDSDSAEIGDWLEERGGYIFEGGGSPYAPAYVQFEHVKDTAAMDKKLLEVLPGLDDLMSHLDDKAYMKRVNAHHEAWDKANKPQWPNTTPPDKTDPYWEFNNNLNANGVPYKKVEVSPGKWQWVIDEKSLKAEQEYEDAKWKLFADLSRRKLTHQELMGVNTSINLQNMQSYFAVDKYAELYDALVAQWELQTGRKMEGYRPLSTAKGQYNRSPQEEDSKRAVEDMIVTLQNMTKPTGEGK